jgi:hypothetical protein
MKNLKWYEKYVWIVFVLVALAGLVPGLLLLFSPMSAGAIVENFGHPIPAGIMTDADGLAFLEFFFRWVGTVLIGGNSLTIFIAATAFRKGEKWAWLAFWYWPLMFASHFLMYAGGFKVSQVVWFILTTGALLMTYRYCFGRESNAWVKANQSRRTI